MNEYLYSVKISKTELALAPTPAVIESPRAATTWKKTITNGHGGPLEDPQLELGLGPLATELVATLISPGLSL